MNRILISGSVAYDRIMDFDGFFRDHFLPEKLHTINVSFSVAAPAQEFGGTAGNIAYTLALLEERASIIATVGSDFSEYRKHLDATGIDASLIAVRHDLPTASAYIMTDRGDNQIAAFSAGAGALAYGNDLPQEVAALGIVAPSCVSDMLMLPDYFRRMKVPHFYDPGQQITVLDGDQLKSGINGATTVFANDYELSLIGNKTGWGEKEIAERVEALIVTYGAEGSRIITRAGETRIPAVTATHVADPTGAGDGYRAGFAKGFLAQLPFEVCAKLGSCAAAYVVERRGTQNHGFTKDEFRKRFQGAYGEPCPI